MNIFRSLDLIFPCGANRTSGEVVSVDIAIHLNGREIGRLDWKRKAWYVNASVNAFHMHRGLVREFRERYAHEFSFAQENAVRRLIVHAVLNSYLANAASGIQYSTYIIKELESPGLAGIWALTWCMVEGDVTILDQGWGLQETVDLGTEATRRSIHLRSVSGPL